MRQTGLMAGIALVTLFAGCNKIKQLANINVNIPYNAQVTVPTVEGDTAGFPLPPGGVTLPFPTLAVPTNSQQYIAEYNTSTDKILNVDLQSLALQILSPASQNFNFLDSVEIYISTSTLPEMLVAYDYNVAKNATTLDLTAETNLNLKTYFIQDTIIFRISTHINAIPASGTQLNIASTFHLLANPLD
jgi:hypothetical protein